jgi:hypothetical protein
MEESVTLVSEHQESLELVSQFIVARGRSGVYIERCLEFTDFFDQSIRTKLREGLKAKGVEPLIGCVHCFRNKATGKISSTHNYLGGLSDEATPVTLQEQELMGAALVEIRYADLFLKNLQDSRVQQTIALYPLECQDCKEGRPLCL